MIQELAGRLAVALSRLLAPEDREAVLGDLTESGATPSDSVRQLLGLIVRRGALGWIGIEPCVAVAAVAVPCGLVLSFVTRWWTESATAQISSLLTVWFPGYFAFPGTTPMLTFLLLRIAAEATALVAWSWTIGSALQRLSHRHATVAASVLFTLLFAGTTGTSTLLARHGTPETFPRTALLTIAVRLALVAGPLVLAMRRPTNRQLVTAAVACSATILTIATAAGLETAFTFGRGIIPPPGPDGIVGTADDVRRWIPWIAAVLLWPGWYSIASARRRRNTKWHR